MKSEKIVLQLLLARVFLSNNKERKRANTCVAHVSGEEETNKENDGGILEKGIRARCERGAIHMQNALPVHRLPRGHCDFFLPHKTKIRALMA